MSRRPIYMRSKKKAYMGLILLLAAIVGVIYMSHYGYSYFDVVLKNSELNGRNFKGKVKKTIAEKSGVEAYFMKVEDTGLVALSFVFKNAGAAYEENGQNGIAALVASTISKGAGRKSAYKLQEEMALKGIKLYFNADKDNFSGTMVVPYANLTDAVSILNRVLVAPKFEEKFVETAKNQTIKKIEAEKENPNKELALRSAEFIYGEHSYARNVLGNIDTIRLLTGKDLKRFVKEYFVKDNLYVGITGNLTDDEVVEVLDGVFADLPKMSKKTDIDEVKINWNRNKLIINRETGQNIASIVYQGTCRKCEDFYPLYIANYIFGGAGLNSRLNMEMREKEGLTYGGYSTLVLNNKANLLSVSFSTTSDNYEQAEAIFFSEWQKVRDEGFSKDELSDAKSYLISSFNLRFATTSGIAEMLAYMQLYDLEEDFLQNRNRYVQEVTLEQLNKIAEKYFTDNRLYSVIGNFN